MDAFFPDLYGIVNMKPSAEVLAARWTAVADLARSETRGRIVDLVRVSAGCAGAEPAAVVEAARAADAAFQSLNSDAEVRVLASAALCELFKAPGRVTDAAALATIALALNGTQGDELSKHVQRAAKHYLNEEALCARQPTRISTALTAEKRTAAVQTYEKSAAPPAQNAAAVGEPIADLVKQLTEPYIAAIKELCDQLAALREESDMCWWVLAEYSQHLQQRFADIGLRASCLVAARELAEMTMFLPGPRSAAALLDRILAAADTSTDALTIPEAVNATPRQWRESWISQASPSAIGNLAPILLAVQHSLSTESDTDWVSAFSKSTDIRDMKLSPPALALQAYTESLLVRAVNLLAQ